MIIENMAPYAKDTTVNKISEKLNREGFNPENWVVKETPLENFYTISNLSDSVEFSILEEENGDITPMYTVFTGAVGEDKEARTITEAIEKGTLPYQDGGANNE
ncbi:hypothetical protein FAM18124_02106 [Lacticaseibacillus paracasei]|uniref:hypothetical protein n=1 Tax=Lacticaseibacillus paracasei TaxID=1597 RepID=UPI000F4395B1|nr:hypothetical protein [Lacticaseibacillus paracasei]RND62129.1 hypothetical protein FAM18124_02106 [Lacticaseibacillus paracasei]RND68737.1 hypothetical protein FAM18129_02187 [Lacticaseibacillus paracasei]